MLVHFCLWDIVTTSFGGTRFRDCSPSFAIDMCQFWHQGQLKLHPTLLIENARLPG